MSVKSKPASLKYRQVWNNYAEAKSKAEQEWAKGNMTPNQYKATVWRALDKACNTDIYAK